MGAHCSATDGEETLGRGRRLGSDDPETAAPRRDAAVASRTDPGFALTVIWTSPLSAVGASSADLRRRRRDVVVIWLDDEMPEPTVDQPEH